MSNKYFAEKVVVITGGAGGLGQELTSQLLDLNAKVVALDLNVDQLTANDNLLPIAADITQLDSLSAALTAIMGRFGKIDILFNNAGITHMSRFNDLDVGLFKTIMDVNFTGAVDITRLCLPELIRNKGQIVAVSSVAGFAPLYGRSAYAASKHAMEGFFLSLGAELKEQGVSVTMIRPSFVRSRPELKAQVNGGISSPGAMKKNTQGEQISPEVAAKKILKATEQRKMGLYLGRVSNIAQWLYKLLPSVYMSVMSKGAKQEFADS
jgi:NAD(P)-dependent dehydrogenase (short-subunit alcohol dehydrogenase family)